MNQKDSKFIGFMICIVIPIVVLLCVLVPAFGQPSPRWYLVKIYAHQYIEETACMMDLEQAAQMSPKGTRFKCERIIP